MKKFLLFTLLTILFAVPLSSHAVATLPFYKVCTDNDQCISDDCETTTELNKSYCDCDDNADCSTEYGTGTWECKNGTTESYQLDYCVDTTTGNDQLDKLDETLEQTGLKIGEKCSSDTDCITNQCEDSDIDIDPDNYCVCDTAQHCAATYGGLAVDWTCKNGITSSHALNYCEKTDGTSILPISTENIISAVEAQENQAKLHGGRTIDFAPPKLSVLGDICKLTNVTFKEGETSSVPWIGQCVTGIYNYMMIIGTMLAVLFIVIGGIIYIASAGNSQKAGTGKDFITKSIFGLVILLSSYLILNTVNPKLTNLNSISVDVIKIDYNGEEPYGQVNQNKPLKPPFCGTETPKIPYVHSYGINDPNIFGLYECILTKVRRPSEIVNITLHEGWTNAQSTVNVWSNAYLGVKKYPVGAHYIIERNGNVYQVIDERFKAIHANLHANNSSIGIDLAIPKGCSQSPSSPTFKTCAFYTNEQYTALNALMKNIASRHPIKLDDNHVFAHCQVKASNHGDPRGFDWTKIGLNPARHFTDPSYPKKGSCLKTFPK